MLHFVAICEFELELWSGKAQIGAKFALTSVTLTFDFWPWSLTCTSWLSMEILPEIFMMIRSQEHSGKRCDGRTDGQTERSVLRAAWSQLRIWRIFIHSIWWWWWSYMKIAVTYGLDKTQPLTPLYETITGWVCHMFDTVLTEYIQ